MSFTIGQNSANYQDGAQWNGTIGNITSVGTNGGPSAYGTRDQGGNVWEWTETTIQTTSGYKKNIKGGSWNSTTSPNYLSSQSSLASAASTTKSHNFGFRLVALSNADSGFVGIGDLGNNADTNSYGSVAYAYSMMVNPVTNTEYTTFLNAVDSTGTNVLGLYSSSMGSDATRGGISLDVSRNNGHKFQVKSNMGNKPVNYVNWLNAARMSNWLHNGKGSGSTETGAYLMEEQLDGVDFERQPGATFAIPSHDEWYKAAYYKGGGTGGTDAGYWLYPTQYNSAPAKIASSASGDGPVVNAAPSPTPTNSPTPTPTATTTQTPTPTATPTNVIITTPTSTATTTPTNTPTTTSTQTPTPTNTPTRTVTPTITPTPTTTSSPTTTPTNTPTSTLTPTPTLTPTHTSTPTKTPTNTKSPTPTNTPTITTTPTNTPTNSLPAVLEEPPIAEMMLDRLYSIQEYKGSTNLPLSTYPTAVPRADWDIFMDNISAIYATVPYSGSLQSFWTIPSGNTNAMSPISTLSSLETGRSYYFILKDIPERPIKIPATPMSLPSNPNLCTSISLSGLNNIAISGANKYAIPINIFVSGLDTSKTYSYEFKSQGSSKPFSMYPSTGTIEGNIVGGTTNISSLFSFLPDGPPYGQTSILDSTNTISSTETNASVKLIVTASHSTTLNTANFKNLAIWNNRPNLTDVGTNGSPSEFGIFDMAGQLYEWTDTNSNKIKHKKLRGGCWKDNSAESLSKYYVTDHEINSIFNDGGFGLRLASYTNSFRYIGFTPINTANTLDRDTLLGSVSYNFYIQTNLVTNAEYCYYLNAIDREGTNSTRAYTKEMTRHYSGGISFDKYLASGLKYGIKLNMGQKPVNFISWTRAAQYCNWINNDRRDTIDNNSYDLSIMDVCPTRKSTADYFLPSENEWYKAAFYNGTNGTYYKYPTKSNIDPTPIQATELGIGDIPYESCSRPNTHSFTVSCSSGLPASSLILDSGPSIKFIPAHPANGADIVLTKTSGNLYPINTIITNLVADTTYLYSFRSISSNWQSNIHPISGQLVAKSGSANINSLLTFCSEDNGCDSFNLDYTLDPPNISKALNNSSLYNILELSVVDQNNLVSSTDSLLVRCDDCLVQEAVAITKFQTPSGSNIIEITNAQSNTYVPLIIQVSGIQPNERYSYSFDSVENNVSFFPRAGSIYFDGGTNSASTFNGFATLALVGDSINSIATVSLTRILTGTSSTDSVDIRIITTGCVPPSPTPTKTPTPTPTKQ